MELTTHKKICGLTESDAGPGIQSVLVCHNNTSSILSHPPIFSSGGDSFVFTI